MPFKTIHTILKFAEWHEGKNGKMTLKDIDETSERELGWTRHNTMMHYMVKDKSKMALLAKLDMGEESDQLDPDYGNFSICLSMFTNTSNMYYQHNQESV